MTNHWTITIRPPFIDTAWAIVRATFVDPHYWHAETKQDAINRLKQGIQNPRDVPGDNPPLTESNLKIDAHSDYTSNLTPDQLFNNQTGLNSFRKKPTTTPWYKRQTELEYLPSLTDPDRVLKLTDGDGPADHPSEWNWNRAVWIKRESDSTFSVMLHRPETYSWVKKTNIETSEVVRILQGRWHTQGSHHLKQIYYEKSVNEDQCSNYLSWDPQHHEYLDIEQTPFSKSWDFCPGVPSSLDNGWEYDPHASLSREVWRSTNTDHERRVELNHNYDEFSFLKVFDGRVSGADSAMVPDGFKSKRQAEADPVDLRDRAVTWMKQNSPKRVSHPAYDTRLTQAPVGWELARVGVRRGNKFYVHYSRSVTVQTTAIIEIAGPERSNNFEIVLKLKDDDGTTHWTDENPINLPAEASIQVAHSRCKQLASETDDKRLLEVAGENLNGKQRTEAHAVP